MIRILAALVSVLLLLLTSCGTQKSIELTDFSSDTIDPAVWTACNDNLDADYSKPGAVVVPYKINSIMLDPTTGQLVCTPRGVREKIKKVFDLYASIPEANIAFKYVGPDDVDYSQPGNDAINAGADGNLHIILTENTTGYSGIAQSNWYWGVPGNGFNNPTGTTYTAYPGGYVSLVLHDTAGHQQPNAISFGLMLHEIGHSLGLDHIPAKGANMSRYGGYAPSEYYAFTEQERANIAAVLPAPGANVFQITGTVSSTIGATACATTNAFNVLNGYADVYAVNIVNGRTFSGLVHCSPLGKFWINLLEPGDYRLVVNPNGYPNMGFDPSAQQASWYVNNTTSTNDPTAGTIITVNVSTPKISGLTLNMINSASPFFINAGYATSDPIYYQSGGVHFPLSFSPNYMHSGDSGIFDFFIACQGASGGNPGTAHCDPITSLEPYGTSPDYSFSDLTLTDDEGVIRFYTAKVTIGANAAPGHRLTIAKAASGAIQVINFGVYVLKAGTAPVNVSSAASLTQQIQGYYDFTKLNALWWW